MFLHILDPLDGLSLWVHHQRPSTAFCDNDSIFSGKCVRRQSFDVPVTHIGWISQECGKGEVGRTGNL